MANEEKRAAAAAALRSIANSGDAYGKLGKINETTGDYDFDVPGNPGFVFCRIEKEGTTEPGICIPMVALEPEVRVTFINVNGVLVALRPDFLDAVNLLGVLAPSLLVPMLPASGRGGIGNLTPATNSVIAGDGQGWTATPLSTLLTAIGWVSGHEILVDDVGQTQRTGLNLLPSDWLVPVGADDAGNDETEFAYTLDPAGVTDIGTPASDDKLPIWDESANLLKYVEAGQFGGGSLPAFGTQDTVTIASGILDISAATSRNIIVAAESSTSDTVDEVVGLADGDVAVFQADSGDTITFANNSDIHLYNGANLAISGDDLLMLVGRGSDVVTQPVDDNSGSGSGLDLILDYTETTDLHTGGFFGTSWFDIITESFTPLTTGNVLITFIGNILAGTGANVDFGVRVLIDSTDPYKLGGGRWVGAYANLLVGCPPLALEGLSLASHTLTLQCISSAAGATIFLRASSEPDTESLQIQVMEY